MKKRILCLLLICTFLPFFGKIQAITLNDFLKQVSENHPFFMKESLTPEIELKKQESLSGDQDWVIRAGPFYAHEEGTKTDGFTPDKADYTGIDTALERIFWKTGGLLSLQYSYIRSNRSINDFVIPFSGGTATIPGDSGMFYENGFRITYSHPLLQNSGGVLSRLSYELQGYNVKAANLTSLEKHEAFLLDVGDRFIDWALLTEQRRIMLARLELAKEELERTLRKRRQNLVDEVDVLRARDAALNAKQNLLGIEAGWKAKQVELAAIAQIDRPASFAPEYDIYTLAALPALGDAIEELTNNSRILTVFRTRIEQLEHQKKGFIEQARPKLNLDISGGLKSGNDEFDNSFGYDKPQFSTSLNLSYPLGNRRSRADILRTDLEKNRIREDMKNVELEFTSTLKNLMTHIKELEKVLSVNEEQLIVARDKTEAELHRYNQGRIELTFVIQSRDNEQNIQLIHARNGAIYHKLLLRYNELMDNLL